MSDLWIQSLLLISPHDEDAEPARARLVERQRQSLLAQGNLLTSGQFEHNMPTSGDETAVIRGGYASNTGPALTPSGPVWAWAERYPSFRVLIQMGNEVVAPRFPVEISCLLHCVLWQKDETPLSFTWKIAREETPSEIISTGETMPIWHPLSHFAPVLYGTIVNRSLKATFPGEGLYIITVELNQRFGGQIPLFVRKTPTITSGTV